jgi:hypothetical protein
VLIFGTKGIALAEGSGGHEPLLSEMGKFFRTDQPPVSARKTLEIMEAADESKRRSGAAVTLESVTEQAGAKSGLGSGPK